MCSALGAQVHGFAPKTPRDVAFHLMVPRHKQNGSTSAVAPEARSSLRRAGWKPTRSVRTSICEEAYAHEGLQLLPKPKAFLRKFGGLVIPYVTKSQQQDVLDFLAERAIRGMKHGIKGFEKLLVTAPLCPVGHYLFGTCILLMDRKGQIFGGSDETLTRVGNTGEKAISNILGGIDAEILENASKK
jgi:hypothetical protein